LYIKTYTREKKQIKITKQLEQQKAPLCQEMEDCACANGFPGFAEGCNVVTFTTFTINGIMSFRGRLWDFGWIDFEFLKFQLRELIPLDVTETQFIIFLQ
jgi:hypothetical protein